MNKLRLWWATAAALACPSFLPLPLPAEDAPSQPENASSEAVPARAKPLSVEELQALFPEALHDKQNQCLTFCLGKARLIAFYDPMENIGFISIQHPSGQTAKVTSRLAALLRLRDISHKALGYGLLIDEKLLREARLRRSRALIPASRMAFVDGLLNWDENASEDSDSQRKSDRLDIRFSGWKSSRLCFRIRDSIHGRSVSYEIGIVPSETELRSLSIRTLNRLSDDEFCDALKKRLRLHGHYTDDVRVKNLRAKTGFSRLLLYSKFHNIYIGVIRPGLYGLVQGGSREERSAAADRTQPIFPKKTSSWPSEPNKTGPAFAGNHSPAPDAHPKPSDPDEEATSRPGKLDSPANAPREELPLLTPQQALRAYIEKLRTL